MNFFVFKSAKGVTEKSTVFVYAQIHDATSSLLLLKELIEDFEGSINEPIASLQASSLIEVFLELSIA